MKKLMCVLSAMLLLACTNNSPKEESEVLHFNNDGKFKIVQFTDIHYAVDKENSRQSIDMMNRVLDIEKPDLVIFTGDIITCQPQKQGWDEVLQVPIDHKIPYAVTLGNHDDEHDWTRPQIIEYIADKPYCLPTKGTTNIKGVGNTVLEIKNKEGKTGALLYCLDSNAYNTVNGQKGYDWFGSDQIEWYRKNSRAYTGQNQGVPYPALAFFHIPFHEYSLLEDTTRNYVKTAPVFGIRTEKECPGIINTGMFAAMVECGDVMGTFVGHDHNNNYIGYLNGICLGYGQFSGSKNTYTDIGYGARVIELTANNRTFNTWIRNSNAENEVLFPVSYPDSFLSE